MTSDLGIELAELGYLPDIAVRWAIRRLCRARLSRHLAEHETAMDRFVSQSRHGPIAAVPEKANQQHYELPPEFFAYALGRRRKYSCCYWPEALPHENENIDELDAAEVAALELTTLRAKIEDGMHVLDLGCGWGSLTLWLAEHFPGCQIIAVSNSASQRQFIEARLDECGYQNRVRVITSDMNDFATEAQFDRVVSVEMFEHMRNHAELLRRIATWLAPDGALFVHIFCHSMVAYPFDIDGDNDWMARHFFTGGMMPSFDWLRRHDQHLEVEASWWLNGIHYQKTCNAWLAKMSSFRHEVMPILARTYGNDSALRWYHRWRMFYMACAELFGLDGGRQWGVSHSLLRSKSFH